MPDSTLPSYIEPAGDDSILRIKAVPGASRDALAGPLGDRFKIRIAAAPEAGKANTAICRLLAKTLDVKRGAVNIEAGAMSPEKTVRIAGVAANDLHQRLDGWKR